MIISKPSQVALSKVHIYGAILRETSLHDGSKARYYVGTEVLGKFKFIRVSKSRYALLNNAAKYKCAFSTNVKDKTVQYQHSIGF